ncbi:hypothetical protein [Chryseobacterium lactis]|uniref:hypothetical protein n=1 Tax=Chryseobacterium lactis TaxID=1241981 RepID=UPI0016242263|nr:hypothetical protein [Chryseobacterium lactis]
MKNPNIKRLNRTEQKEIKGSGPVKKCSTSVQCDPGQCCEGGMCMYSPIIQCEPIFE